MRIRRRPLLVLLLVLASCAAQVATPRSDSPSSQPSVTPDLSPDAIYVRQAGNVAGALISVLDARTGMVLRGLPDGVLSADRSTLYRAEPLNGASQTRISVIDVATGRDVRAVTIDGAFGLSPSNEGPTGLTSDSRLL